MTSDHAARPVQASPNSDLPTRDQRHLKGWWILIGVLVSVVIIDQVSKEIALHALLRGPITVGGIRLSLVANRGILLGIPAPAWAVVAATILVLIIAFRSNRNAHWSTSLAFGLLAGGAIGNLADRFQDRHFFPSSAVVDWISAGRITFNLADVFLVAGVAMLVFLPASDTSRDADPTERLTPG